MSMSTLLLGCTGGTLGIIALVGLTVVAIIAMLGYPSIIDAIFFGYLAANVCAYFKVDSAVCLIIWIAVGLLAGFLMRTKAGFFIFGIPAVLYMANEISLAVSQGIEQSQLLWRWGIFAAIIIVMVLLHIRFWLKYYRKQTPKPPDDDSILYGPL